MRRTIVALWMGWAILAAQAVQPAVPVQIHRHMGGENAYEANAYWLESKEGLVLIDTLLLRSEARTLVGSMKSTGKPLLAILITHPHLDHFGGIRTVLRAFGKVPVLATPATAAAIRPVHDLAMKTWAGALGEDYEKDPYIPDTLVPPGTTLTLAGMRFHFKDYGPMEADNNTVIHNLETGALFTGDATVSHAPYYVGEGHSVHALAMLDRLQQDFPTGHRAYSGHYESRALEAVVAENREYIQFMRNTVESAFGKAENLTADGSLNAAARREVTRILAERYRSESAYGMPSVTMAQMNLAGLLLERKAKNRALLASTTNPPVNQ